MHRKRVCWSMREERELYDEDRERMRESCMKRMHK